MGGGQLARFNLSASPGAAGGVAARHVHHHDGACGTLPQHCLESGHVSRILCPDGVTVLVDGHAVNPHAASHRVVCGGGGRVSKCLERANGLRDA